MRTTTGDWTGDAFAHEAFLYDDVAALRQRVLPFLDEARERDEPVVVVVARETASLLREELGEAIEQLFVFEESETWWRGDAHRTLAAYAEAMSDLVERGEPWRLVGEPIWVAHDGGDRWSRLESACNASFAALPYYSLCLHDRRRLDASTLERVVRTHPTTWDGARVVPCDDYVHPADYLRAVEPAWVERPPVVDVVEVTSPAQARTAVAAVSASVEDPWAVQLAVSELASNALAAAASCRVSAWLAGEVLVVEVDDDGPGFDVGLAGYVPPMPSQLGGRGLWIVRQVADDVSIRSGSAGTTSRAYFRTTSATPG